MIAANTSISILATVAQAQTFIRNAETIVASIDDIHVDHTKNFREESQYDVDTLLLDLQSNGQSEPIIGYIDETGKLLPVRGNRRATAFMKAQSSAMVFIGGEFASLPMATNVKIIVLPRLSPEVEFALRFDHSQRKGLSKYGLTRAVVRALELTQSEKQIVLNSADLLNEYYRPKRPVKPVAEDGGADLLAYHRGTMQIMRAVFQAPTELKNAYYAMLEGKQTWPTTAELKDLVKIHLKEMEADTTHSISQDKPGPEFTEKWNQKLEAVADGEETGNKPKSVSMLNRGQVTTIKKAAKSRTMKIVAAIVLGDISVDKWLLLDALLADVEKTLSTEQQSVFTTIVKADAVQPEAAKPEAAKPEAAKPEAAKPEAATPETETVKPETVKPETVKPHGKRK